MITTGKLRILNGCFAASDNGQNSCGHYIVPGLLDLSCNGIYYLNKDGTLNDLVNLISTDPEGGGDLGNSITAVGFTPKESKITVLQCSEDGDEVTTTELTVPNEISESCGAPSIACGITLIGGKSCEATIMNEGDEIKLPTTYWDVTADDNRVILGYDGKPYEENSTFDPAFTTAFPGVADSNGYFVLKHQDTVIAVFACQESALGDTVVGVHPDLVSLKPALEGVIATIDGCGTNPGFSVCNVLPAL
jgi:hypothetical protein